jgi:ABC-2 type transport system ATP-binding protein
LSPVEVVSASRESSAPAPGAAADISAPAAGDAGLAISARGLTKTYQGDVVAVDGLDLSVRTGEIFGLLGPNGAGKTTTVGMLTTRVLPSSGRAWVGGVDVVADPAGARGACGVVSQGNTLDRGLSVRDNLYFHGRYCGMTRARAREAADRWLESFQLSHRAKAPVGTLSGGMARRLMLARAMLHGPSVLFLDEPTAGLDPQSRLGMWDLVSAMHAAGQTVLLTTHYMEEADQHCDRVAIMDQGRILALDTPASLKRPLARGASVTLAAGGDRERLARALAGIQGVRVSPSADGLLRLRVRSAEEALAGVISAAHGCGYALREVSMELATLETVFIELTGRELRE